MLNTSANESTPSAHQARLRDYFDGIGFERWSAIYGHDEVSGVRQTVREGHARMLETAQRWLAERATPATLLDVGCGTGLFSVAMAQRGYTVSACDIAPRMVAATQERVHAAGLTDRVTCQTGDLASISGRYDLVACFDVLIHYPRFAFAQLLGRLARHSRGSLFFTYAPESRLLKLMYHLAHLFPQNQRRTAIQMIADDHVALMLNAAGMFIHRRETISQGFYHVTLVEAHPIETPNLAHARE